jgi:chromosome segregation ATPase
MVMTMGEETALFGAHIDADTAEIIDSRLEYGEKSELVRDLAQAIAYGGDWDERTAIDTQIENVEQRLADAREERRRADAKIETIENELEKLREKREVKQTTEEKLDISLVPIESELRQGNRVFVEHGPVDSVARELKLPAADVIDRLKERNPDVPDYAFEELVPYADNEAWNGVPEPELNTPPENREDLYR